MKTVSMFFLLVSIIVSCSSEKQKSDAYGNFETVEYIVSAEAQGTLTEFIPEEGLYYKQGQYAGCIDTVPLFLKKMQLLAQNKGLIAKRKAVNAQLAVLSEQKRIMQQEKERVKKLLEGNAATQKQLDDIEGNLSLLDKQIASVEIQKESLAAENDALHSQILQVNEQVSKAIVRFPISGTVLEKYTEKYELVIPGKPLFKMASLDTMILKVYVDGSQLQALRLNQKAEVLIDAENGTLRKLSGRVSWISLQAEFTPKTIQTRKERVTLVYAVKIRVPNDGSLKIGMPGEAVFLTRE